MDDLAPGFGLPEPWSARLTLLDWIYESGGERPGSFVALGPLFMATVMGSSEP